mgnify:CR=1 FL=1
MRAGLINIVDNMYIVLELLSSFMSASTTRMVRNAQKTFELILTVFMMLRWRATACVISLTCQDRLLNSVYLTIAKPIILWESKMSNED